MANLPPNHNEFAPAAEAAPDNMNGWVEEEDPEMEEEEEDPEEDPEMEEEEEEMEMNADEEWDGPEWILPYQGADPLYPPPPASDSESEIEFEEAEAEAKAFIENDFLRKKVWVDVVFDDAFRGVRDEEVVVGEEALVEFMVELFEEDEDGKKNEKDGLFNLKANDQSRKA
ncbi:hypothetical protein Tco_1403148 [Tanacetum coccineum]